MCSWEVSASENHLYTNIQWCDENFDTSKVGGRCLAIYKEQSIRCYKFTFFLALELHDKLLADIFANFFMKKNTYNTCIPGIQTNVFCLCAMRMQE